MKKLLVALFALLLCCTVALAHPGGTDAAGGHYDRSTGEYHYHHGHKAHQHYNGQCPYNFDDRTGADSRPSGGSDSGSVEMPVLRNDSDTAEPVKASTSTWDDLVSLITSTKFWLGIAETVIAFAIPVAIYEWAMRSRKKKK